MFLYRTMCYILIFPPCCYVILWMVINCTILLYSGLFYIVLFCYILVFCTMCCIIVWMTINCITGILLYFSFLIHRIMLCVCLVLWYIALYCSILVFISICCCYRYSDSVHCVVLLYSS